MKNTIINIKNKINEIQNKEWTVGDIKNLKLYSANGLAYDLENLMIVENGSNLFNSFVDSAYMDYKDFVLNEHFEKMIVEKYIGRTSSFYYDTKYSLLDSFKDNNGHINIDTTGICYYIEEYTSIDFDILDLLTIEELTNDNIMEFFDDNDIDVENVLSTLKDVVLALKDLEKGLKQIEDANKWLDNYKDIQVIEFAIYIMCNDSTVDDFDCMIDKLSPKKQKQGKKIADTLSDMCNKMVECEDSSKVLGELKEFDRLSLKLQKIMVDNQ